MRASWVMATMLAAAAATGAQAAPAKKHAAKTATAAGDYLTDVITVVSADRHGVSPTASCTLWVNAEGLGVGPAQLDGYHGLQASLNPKPLASEGDAKPVGFDSAFGLMKAKYPTAPAWLLAAVQKQKAAIEAACAEEHMAPMVIARLTAKDKG